jgi:hypothetical protein
MIGMMTGANPGYAAINLIPVTVVSWFSHTG